MNARPFQLEGAKYLSSGKKRLLFDDPGLGKTLQALIAAASKFPAPVLVICPAYVKSTWLAEAKKWGLPHTCQVLKGKNSFAWPKPGECVITNSDILPDDVDRFMWQAPRECIIILDEAHMYNSQSAARSKKVAALRKAVVANDGSVWGLTGTPVMSYPEDLWGMLSVLGMEQDVYGRRTSFDMYFRKRLINVGGFWKSVWGEPLPDAARLLSQHCLGRSRLVVSPEIPRKDYQTHEVSVTASSSRFDEMSDEDLEIVLKSGGGASMAGDRHGLAVQKAQAAKDWIVGESSTHPLVVFSYHKDAVEMFNEVPGWAVITGDTPMSKRDALVQSFQAGSLLGLAGTIGAMGVGITLTKSYHAVFIDRDYQPSANIQAEDRICRIGQAMPVVITDLTCNSKLDTRVFSILKKKQDIITASVDAAREGNA
jgi:SWI/SNF-related matrix-associated actin-dependent regulator 1 of chromatin subfamily A